jgi:hypothetical protein
MALDIRMKVKQRFPSVTGHAPQRSRGTPQNRPFPQLNLHSARPPQPRAATSKRIYRTRKQFLVSENAHPVKL